MKDIVERARACIEASKDRTAGHPGFQIALKLVRDGDLEGAASELYDTFDDPALVLATMFLERFSVSLGHESVEALSAPLLEQVPAGALDYGWIARRFDSGWSTETAGRVAPHRTARRDEQGGFASLSLLTAVEALVDAGELEKAREHLSEFGWYHKRESGCAHALVGASLADDTIMAQAVSKARNPPMIQDGGEEAEALGAVLAVFAEQGVSVDNPAVKSCMKALKKLGATYVRKDVRSYGLAIGATAAARRGGEWSQIARELLGAIWTDSLKHPVQILLAAQEPDDAAQLLAEVGLDTQLRGLFPEHADDLVAFLESPRKPLDRARLLARHGHSYEALVDKAIEQAQGWYQGVEGIWGGLLLADAKRAEEVFDDLDAPAVALENAALALAADGQLERASEYFIAALEAGFVPKFGTTSELMLEVPALIGPAAEAALEVADREDRMESLSLLAQLRIELGDWDSAAKLVERAIEAPLVEEKPEWTPWSLMGDRTNWRPEFELSVPTTTGEKGPEELAAIAEVPRDEQLLAYYKLARELDPAELSDLRKKMAKAPGGRGDAAQIKKGRLVEVALIDGDIDGALEVAGTMRDCRVSGWGPAYSARTIAAWLGANRESFSGARANAIVALFHASIPQDIPWPLAAVSRVCSPLLDEPDRAPFFENVASLRSKFRHDTDTAAVRSIIAMGQYLCGLKEGRRAMKALLESARSGTYTGRLFYVRMLQYAGLLDDTELVKRAVTMDTGERIYAQTMTLERVARILWHEGVDSPLPALIRDGVFPSEVCEQLRRSLVVMAPDYSPDPVADVLAVWLDVPPNVDQAIEQVANLARALEADERKGDAVAIREALADTR